MNIEKAYCVELGRSININDARNEYYYLERPRKRFTFRCSSPACREDGASPVVIKAVNYDKPTEDHERYQRAHFRSVDVASHSLDCNWVIEAEAAQLNYRGKTESRTSSQRKPVEAGYIQRSTFLLAGTPSKTVDDKDLSVQKEPSKGPSSARNRSSYISAARKRLEQGKASASFSELVSDYLEINRKQKWDSPLSIDGLPIETYGQFFKKIQWYDPNYCQNHAYFGSVTVKKVYPDDFDFSTGLPSAVALKFDQEATVDDVTSRPTLYLTKDDFEGAVSAHVFAEAVQLSIGNDKYSDHLWCHFYGEVRKKTATYQKSNSNEVTSFETLNIVPKSMKTLELILRRKTTNAEVSEHE